MKEAWFHVAVMLTAHAIAQNTNYALYRPARQSSTSNKPASQAVDGILWKASETRNEFYPYWIVNLQASIWVTSIALTNRDSSYYKRLANFTVLVGGNSNWRLNQHCYSQVVPVPRAQTVEYRCQKPRLGHLVSINKTSVSQSLSYRMLMLQEVQVFGFKTGAAYRFGENNVCNHMKTESEEVAILTDGNLSTCEIRNGNTVDLFGLFLRHYQQRILVSLIGRALHCSPANGVMVAIISTSQEGQICQAMFSHYSDRCRYRCFCTHSVTYSHITIAVPAHGGDICEISLD